MNTAVKLASSIVLLVAVNPVAHAAVITQWDFNAPAIGVNNSPAPSTGAGSATPVGMTNNANNADILNANSATSNSSDPITPANNRGWRVRGSVANGWSGTTQLLSGAQFNASTLGQQDVVVSLDIFATDGSPRHAQFQYTTDGTSFVSFGGLLDFNPTNDRWTNGVTFDLSSISSVDNNPAFGFKIVSAFSPVEFTNANGLQPANTAFQRANAALTVYNGTAGNYRFDYVTISGTVIPEPSALAPLAAAALLLGRKRR